MSSPSRAQILGLYRSYLATAQSFVSSTRLIVLPPCVALARSLGNVPVLIMTHRLNASSPLLLLLARSRHIISAPTSYAALEISSGLLSCPLSKPPLPRLTRKLAPRRSKSHHRPCSPRPLPPWLRPHHLSSPRHRLLARQIQQMTKESMPRG